MAMFGHHWLEDIDDGPMVPSSWKESLEDDGPMVPSSWKEAVRERNQDKKVGPMSNWTKE